jgi:glutaredoxin-like protein
MLIDEENRRQLAEFFEERLESPVRLVMFTQHASRLDLPFSRKCEGCDTTENIIAETISISDKLSAEIVDFANEPKLAAEYGIYQIPAIAIIGEKDYGIRYYGMPVGYEFTAFIESIANVSAGITSLAEKAKDKLHTLENKVHIKVFVTPTCPYCPSAVIISQNMAIENDFITAEMIEVQEFPQLAQKYAVYAVPKVILNENDSFEGALPDYLFADHVLAAAGQPADALD